MICSATLVEWRSSNGPGVAETKTSLRHQLEELVEAQRPVVERRRQPEAVLDERLLARAVALVHAADLRHRLVRLVDEEQEVVREVVEQRVRRRARRRARRGSASSSRSRCSSRARASSPCRTRCAAGSGAPRASCPAASKSSTCSSSSAGSRRAARSIVGRVEVTYCVAGKIAEVLEPRVDLAGERVEVRDLLDLVAEERDRGRPTPCAPAAPRPRRRARGSGRGRGTSRCAEYWMSTSLRSMTSRSISSPTPRSDGLAPRTPPASRGRRCRRPRRR